LLDKAAKDAAQIFTVLEICHDCVFLSL